MFVVIILGSPSDKEIGQQIAKALEGLDIPSEMRVEGAYAAAGVDIQAGSRAVELVQAAVKSTYTPAVLAGIDAFGGLFDLKGILGARDPALVASTDGVGRRQ